MSSSRNVAIGFDVKTAEPVNRRLDELPGLRAGLDVPHAVAALHLEVPHVNDLHAGTRCARKAGCHGNRGLGRLAAVGGHEDSAHIHVFHGMSVVQPRLSFEGRWTLLP
ncbi:MAG TPA: hypothetical protein VGT01_01380 [Candidatus Dormibacteraeota bacterium]|nr:hypothetical protein [Candidatus Dormibacteraeota bacterium]HEV2476544.1 hypothetical protein [Candidatus Dormibacteraeota bacterium]